MENIKIFAFADEASADINEQITALKRNELSGLEIRNVDGVNVSDISNYKAKEVKKKLDDAGLKIWSIGSPIGKIDILSENYKLHCEKFLRTLEIADILGAENIRLFSFFIPKDKNPEDFKSEVINRLGDFTELNKNTGITLCHENEKGIFGDIPKRCIEIHKALPAIKSVFDPANFIQCGVDTLKAWEMLKTYVKYLHIKDALSDGNIVPAGKGIGNIKEILNSYVLSGKKEITLEPHLTVFDGLSDLENEGGKSAIGEIYHFSSNNEAFDYASKTLKEILM